jgi:hypothetical protein
LPRVAACMVAPCRAAGLQGCMILLCLRCGQVPLEKVRALSGWVKRGGTSVARGAHSE